MAYFLGRDVKVAMTTEHEAFSIKYASNTLDIRGTASNAVADDDAVPRRPIGLKVAGTAGAAEVSTITVSTATEANFESTSSSSNKAITLFDPDGDTYVIDFETAGGSSYVQTSQAAAATGAALKITLATDEGGTGAIATEIADDINADATFSKLFTASASGAIVTITNAQTGDATDILRGSGFDGDILVVATGTQGVDASNIISDITGVDITIGTVDEDIAYLGQRTALKAEIKNEVTLVLTRKKSDASFDLLYNKARCGIRATTGATALAGGTDNVAFDINLNMPTADASGSGFGYRLYLELKGGSDVLSLSNMCILDHSVTFGADAVQEESITFYGNVEPIISTATVNTTTAETAF